MVCNTHYYWVSGLCQLFIEFRTIDKVQKPSSNESLCIVVKECLPNDCLATVVALTVA
jgi:hypothetical protein